MNPMGRGFTVSRSSARPAAGLASGLVATLAFGIATTALAADSLSAATAQTVRVRIHALNGTRESLAVGDVVVIAGDTLLFTRLHVDREERDTRNGPVRFGLLDADRIEVLRSSSRHVGRGAIIGGLAGVVLGFVGTQIFTTDPLWGTRYANRDAIWAPVGGGAFGALLGAGIGALTHTQRWEPVDREQLRGLLERRAASAPPR
jgi:hypothetical protein